MKSFLVLVGPGLPVRDEDPEGDNDVILFLSRNDAEQWITDHPKAKNPYIVEPKVVYVRG